MNEANFEDLVAKAGGPFRLVSLFQKRVRELQRGLPTLVEPRGRAIQEIVVEEILSDKIWLVAGAEAEAMRQERRAREALERPPREALERAKPPEAAAAKN